MQVLVAISHSKNMVVVVQAITMELVAVSHNNVALVVLAITREMVAISHNNVVVLAITTE